MHLVFGLPCAALLPSLPERRVIPAIALAVAGENALPKGHDPVFIAYDLTGLSEDVLGMTGVALDDAHGGVRSEVCGNDLVRPVISGV